MLYVYLRSGAVREVTEAVATRLSVAPGGDVLECLDSDGQVVARFVAAEVFFYSRRPRDEFRGLPPNGPASKDDDEPR